MTHIPINLASGDEFQPERPKRKGLFLLILSTLALLITAVSFLFVLAKHTSPSDPNAYDPVTLQPKEPEGIFKKIKQFVFSRDVVVEGEKDDRINFLLLGMGGPGHDGPYLTDTMMIVSVKPSTKQIAMVSIPRDLYVKMTDYGWYKINHANAFGEAKRKNYGGAYATEVIEDVFDIDIHYYARIDFKAFEEIIDEVGGLKVDVERSFVDTQYPAANSKYQTLTFKQGVETMDGARALKFARSRHGNNGEGSDYARAKRQQKVILAMKEKLLSFETLINPLRIHSVMTTLESHITTNMEFSTIIATLKLARELDTQNIITVVLDDSPKGYLVSSRSPDGQYILAPRSGTFDEITQLVTTIFDQPTAVMVDTTPKQDTPVYTPAVIEVQNGTWQAGLAARVQKQLTDKEFEVQHIGNTSVRPQFESGIYLVSNKTNPDMLASLKQTLGIPIKEKLPQGLTFEPTSDILILLGEDFEE